MNIARVTASSSSSNINNTNSNKNSNSTIPHSTTIVDNYMVDTVVPAGESEYGYNDDYNNSYQQEYRYNSVTASMSGYDDNTYHSSWYDNNGEENNPYALSVVSDIDNDIDPQLYHIWHWLLVYTRKDKSSALLEVSFDRAMIKITSYK